MPVLSIIVPIYGVDKYIRKCLDSIKNQSFTDFEAILVDDGSPDQSGEIANEYAAVDPRFIVIHQENQGLSSARNAGLRVANGKYIGSVDPDDWILPDMYSIMIGEAEESGADIVCCGWKTASEEGKLENNHEIDLKNTLLTQNEFLVHLFDSPRTILSSFCNKIFKHTWITYEFDIRFSLSEDRLFLFENSMCKKYNVKCVPFPKYVYRSRSTSLTHQNLKRHRDVLEVEKRILLLCEQMNPTIQQASQKDYLDTCYRYYLLFKQNGYHEEEKYTNQEIIKYIKGNMIRISTNNLIYWKTRIFYLIWYLKNCLKYQHPKKEDIIDKERVES